MNRLPDPHKPSIEQRDGAGSPGRPAFDLVREAGDIKSFGRQPLQVAELLHATARKLAPGLGRESARRPSHRFQAAALP